MSIAYVSYFVTFNLPAFTTEMHLDWLNNVFPKLVSGYSYMFKCACSWAVDHHLALMKIND